MPIDVKEAVCNMPRSDFGFLSVDHPHAVWLGRDRAGHGGNGLGFCLALPG